MFYYLKYQYKTRMLKLARFIYTLSFVSYLIMN